MLLHALIFDLDGTLTDTNRVCALVYQAALARFMDVPPTIEEIYEQYGPSEEGVLEAFLPGGRARTYPAFLEIYQRVLPDQVRLFPGMRMVLRTLAGKGVRLGLVTGKGAHTTALTLRHLGLEDLFSASRSGGLEGGNKAANIASILQSWGIEPAGAAYVGDTRGDMRAAREAGVLALGAGWGVANPADPFVEEDEMIHFASVTAFSDWTAALDDVQS